MNNSTISQSLSIDSTEKNNFMSTSGVVSSLAIFKAVLAVLVAVLSLGGNTIVIFVVFTTKKLHANTYFLIVNMSISDLLYTAVATEPFIAGILERPFPFRGSWGTFICKFVNAMGFGMIASSVLTLAAIAYDRFFAIVFPLKNLKNKTYLKWIVASIWLCSALVMSPMMYAMRLHEDNNTSYCYEDWSPYFDTDMAAKTYTVILFVVIYSIPFLTMFIFYSLMSYILWFRKIPGISDEITRQRIVSGRRKVVRMLIFILVCFILCWLPLQISTFSVYFGDAEFPFEFFFACEFLIRANGAINPIIYVVFNENFRRGFKRVLYMGCRSKLNVPIYVSAKTNFLSLTSSKQSNQASSNQRLLYLRETVV